MRSFSNKRDRNAKWKLVDSLKKSLNDSNDDTFVNMRVISNCFPTQLIPAL